MRESIERVQGTVPEVMSLSPRTPFLRPPSARPPESVQARKAAFDIAKKAEDEYQQALLLAKQALDRRSAAIRDILDTYGAGPYLVDNKEVRIVVRPARKGKGEGETVFFRQLNTKDVEMV